MIGYGHPLAPQVEQALLPLIQSHISGLILSPGTDALHDVDISVGTTIVRDGAGGYAGYEQTGVATIAIDNAADRVDGSSLDATTRYDVLVGLQNGVPVQGFSKVNALPSGWSHYRRILSVYTEASSNIESFKQVNDEVLYTGTVEDVNDSTGTPGVKETATVRVPPKQRGIFRVRVSATNASSYVVGYFGGGGDHLRAISRTDSPTDTQLYPEAQAVKTVSDISEVDYYLQTDGSFNNVIVNSMGWIDDRGRND